jgi:hypothetical protein
MEVVEVADSTVVAAVVDSTAVVDTGNSFWS